MSQDFQNDMKHQSPNKRPMRRGKSESTRARRLLEQIKPYSVFPLDFHPWTLKFEEDENGNTVQKSINIFEQIPEVKKEIESIRGVIQTIQKNKIYEFLDCSEANRLLAGRIYRIISNSLTFTNAPSLKEFEDDVRVFQKIAERHPGFISEAAWRLHIKYSGLHVISEDYVAWREWLWFSKLHAATPAVWSDFLDCNKDAQQEAIRHADLILDAIPPDANIRKGRPKNYGIRALVGAVHSHWVGSRMDPAKHRENFYAYLDKLLVGLWKGIDPEIHNNASSILRPDGKSIRDFAQEAIEGNVPVKKWGGGPQRVIYHASYPRGTLRWAWVGIKVWLLKPRYLPRDLKRRREYLRELRRKQFSQIREKLWNIIKIS